MSKAKEALGHLIEQLDAGKPLAWARKTVLVMQEDGSCLRRITRRDGTMEKEEIIPAERCAALAARAKTGLSQSRFAALLGISVRTLHDWEQGRREPSGAAKTLLQIAVRHPEVLRELGNA
jgi:putative transcriptional regulator